MKKYINKYLAAVLLCSIALITSCKKYINEGPIDGPTDATFWTSERAAESGLAGAYGLLRTALTTGQAYFVFGDATASEFSGYNDFTLGSLVPDESFNFNYVPYREPVLHNWTNFYQAITQCNLIIAKVPGINPSTFTDDPVATKNQIIGEAYFIRAYCYYYISQVWGQPVIVTQAYADPIHAQPVARSTTDAGFAQAVNDLKIAIGLLKYGYTNPANTAVQANKTAAYALLAKTYMYQKQYQLASIAADSVINVPAGFTPNALEPGATYSNIFKGHDRESIFEINLLYSPNQNEAQDGFSGIFSQFLAEPFITGKDATSTWTLNLDLVNSLFDTTAAGKAKDARIKAIFYGLQSDNPLMIKYSNVIYQFPAQQTSPFVSNNLVVLRLADIFLLKAEAAIRTGDQGTALLYLNLVRQRAGLDPAPLQGSTILHTIMDERGREFFCEGSWYFDLVRSGLIDDPSYDNAIDGYFPGRLAQGGNLWPLDLRTLLPQDPLLTQNPYWAVAGQ